MQLKNNFIPKLLVPLEKLLDKNDVPHNPMIHPKEEYVEDVNIGIESEPKNTKISNLLLEATKKRYVKMFKEYIDTFAWLCEYLKT